MPYKAKRLCAIDKCPNTAVPGAAFCKVHYEERMVSKRERQREYDKQRDSAAQRGYDRTWQRLRIMALRREPLCRHCKLKGKYEFATEVDHIVPLAAGGENTFSNLQALCKSCHSRKTAREQARGKGGSNS